MCDPNLTWLVYHGGGYHMATSYADYDAGWRLSYGSTVVYPCSAPPWESPRPEMITITIRKVGNGTGKVLSSGGDNVLAERSIISVPYGYKIYLQAVPNIDSTFVRWVEGDLEATDNPIEILIIEPGNINAEFKLKSTLPPPPQVITIEVGNSPAMSGNYVRVYRNGQLINDTLNQNYYDFYYGDTAKFEAVAAGGYEFVSWNNGVSVQNPFSVPIIEPGKVIGYFKTITDTSGYSCVDNCMNKVQFNAPYKTQLECQAGCVEPPGEPPGGSYCPRGEKYIASQWEAFLGCQEGYTLRKAGLGLPFIDEYECICQVGGAKETPWLGYALIIGIVAFLFGGRR